MLAYNTINLYLLSTLTKDRALKQRIIDSFLFKFKRMIFALTSITIAISNTKMFFFERKFGIK